MTLPSLPCSHSVRILFCSLRTPRLPQLNRKKKEKKKKDKNKKLRLQEADKLQPTSVLCPCTPPKTKTRRTHPRPRRDGRLLFCRRRKKKPTGVLYTKHQSVFLNTPSFQQSYPHAVARQCRMNTEAAVHSTVTEVSGSGSTQQALHTLMGVYYFKQ